MKPAVLFEDDWLLAVDKPAGMAVHPGAGIHDGTVNDWVRQHLGARAWRNGFGASVVHRLDRETSGVLLIARRRPAMRALSEAFEQRLVWKQYRALAFGRLPSGRCDAPLDDQACATRWELAESFPAASLLTVHPETGRKHQIRRHLASRGHPIAGDVLHGNAALNERAARSWKLHRLFLHASRLEFPHPKDGRTITMEAALPVELASVLDGLRQQRPPE